MFSSMNWTKKVIHTEITKRNVILIFINVDKLQI